MGITLTTLKSLFDLKQPILYIKVFMSKHHVVKRQTSVATRISFCLTLVLEDRLQAFHSLLAPNSTK